MAATRYDFRVLRALLAFGVGLLCAGPLAAQDPRASLVQETARAWLADTDRGNAAQSWKNAGKQFRNASSVERFRNALSWARNSARTVPARPTANTRSSFFGPPLQKKWMRAKR